MLSPAQHSYRQAIALRAILESIGTGGRGWIRDVDDRGDRLGELLVRDLAIDFVTGAAVESIHNPAMDSANGRTRAVLSRDTAPEVEAQLVQIWRRLSSIERAQLVAGASRAARALALAGLRARHPGASNRELVARLAALTLDRELARRVYPELDHLDP